MPFGEEFRASFGVGKQYRAFTSSDRQRLASTVPTYLLDLWEVDGWASYRDGLLWFVDPDDYAPVLALWNISQGTPSLTLPLVVARTGFGNLYYLETHIAPNGSKVQEINELDPHISKYLGVGPFAEKFLTRSLAKLDYFRNVLMEPEVQQATNAVGALEWNEMYAYEPALSLGGSGRAETVRRVNIFAHHAMLSQMQQMTLQLL
jgi:hypothetical protein